ncbi:MAG: tRNA preQ1(34) S-adenosylmethionine ribosyltransferase-isomerase QueA [Deltaproteobacteria bacterium]|jgi:S-adenosylmethionine:tRNA ribosyltransferase-isomerase|nr:tRNA preQ1(34) S-adenosylmethionine ribosyltransferase-isomerase QueA [Deltaproteobacteria bacterium]
MSQKILKGLEEYHFHLPKSLIAQEPTMERGSSRLLVLRKDTGEIVVSRFSELHSFLPENTLLVMNEARVTPARLYGESGGSKVELLILNPKVEGDSLGDHAMWSLGKPGKKLHIGARVNIEGNGMMLSGEVLELDSSGRRLIRFHFEDSPSKVFELLGHMPLPPYIKRPDSPEDLLRYQTVYAKKDGAIAAPTAGLHFSKEYLEFLAKRGYGSTLVFLMVGMGTFLPLTEKELISGKLHKEYVEVGKDTADKVNKAKNESHPVLSVGTTTLRALEWAGEDGLLRERKGLTDIFIRPGYSFQIADALLTNFHLPASSLFMLVSAFAGLDKVKRAYELAIFEGFRFYSYGDAMLIV